MRRRRIAQRNQQNEAYLNRRMATFLIAMAAIVCGFSGIYVQQYSESQERTLRIAELTEQISDLKAENDAYENAVYADTDLNTVRTQAEELGMEYLDTSRLRYFTLSDSDYYSGTISVLE